MSNLLIEWSAVCLLGSLARFGDYELFVYIYCCRVANRWKSLYEQPSNVHSNLFRLVTSKKLFQYEIHYTSHGKAKPAMCIENILYFLLTIATKNNTRIAKVIPKKIISEYGVSKAGTASSK